MGKLTLSLAVLFLFVSGSDLYSQGGLKKEKEDRPFSLGLQTGLTIHTHYMVEKRLDENALGVNYFEFLVLYKIGSFEFGVSAGQDEFTIPTTSIGKNITIFPQPDTTYDTTHSYALRTFNWGALNLNYYFTPEMYVGLKGGFDPRRNSIYFAGSFGREILSNKDWGLNAIAQIFTNFGGNSTSVNSYQLNILFNVRFKPDLSGIF
jgi:hypothetical protein